MLLNENYLHSRHYTSSKWVISILMVNKWKSYILWIFYFNLDLKIIFSLFDANRDGKIAKEEINELVSFIAGDITKEDDVIQFMQAIDTNSEYFSSLFIHCIFVQRMVLSRWMNLKYWLRNIFESIHLVYEIFSIHLVRIEIRLFFDCFFISSRFKWWWICWSKWIQSSD